MMGFINIKNVWRQYLLLFKVCLVYVIFRLDQSAAIITTIGVQGGNITLTCLITNVGIYPMWDHPGGELINYAGLPRINPKFPRVSWEDNQRDIVISNLERQNDTGTYTCWRSVGAGADFVRVTLQLRVRPATPYFTSATQSNDIHGNQGVTLTIECVSMNGYPQQTVKIFKENIELQGISISSTQDPVTNQSTVSARYTFTPTKTDHRKSFICQSSYETEPLLTESASAQLYLHLQPTAPSISLRDPPANEFEGLQATCISSGFRPQSSFSLTWRFRGQDTLYSGKPTEHASTETYMVTDTFQPSVGRSDNGQTITCSVNHSALANPLTTTEQVNVTFSPDSVSIQGNGVFTVNGSAYLLTCTASSSNPPLDLIWSHDGSPITSNEQYTDVLAQYNGISRSQVLRLVPTRTMDGHTIACVAGTRYAMDSITLDLNYPPLDEPVINNFQDDSDFYTIENTLQSLTCSVTGGKPLANLTWSCYGQTGNSQTVSDETVSRTVVWTASKGDERQCRCTATHVTGNIQGVAVNVKVLHSPSKPTLTVQSKQVLLLYLTEGDPLTVSCNSSSVPPPDTYTWILPDGTAQPGQHLQIDMIRYHCNLVYTCIAQNHMIPSQGPAVIGTSTAPLSVVLSYAPRHAYRHQVSEDILVTVGQRTILSITLAAYPLPSVYLWEKCKSGVCSNVHNDTNLVTTTIGFTSNLTITSTTREDFGQYMLTVSNGIGLPYNYTFFLHDTTATDSAETNSTLIPGVVGGVVAFAVIVAVAVGISVCLFRRRERGGQKKSSNEIAIHQAQFGDINTQRPAGQNNPDKNTGAELPTAEFKAESEYIELSQYSNTQNPYEELDAGMDLQTRAEKTYTNVMS